MLLNKMIAALHFYELVKTIKEIKEDATFQSWVMKRETKRE